MENNAVDAAETKKIHDNILRDPATYPSANGGWEGSAEWCGVGYGAVGNGAKAVICTGAKAVILDGGGQRS